MPLRRNWESMAARTPHRKCKAETEEPVEPQPHTARITWSVESMGRTMPNAEATAAPSMPPME